MVAHSKIGASGMYRWSKCPGSVHLKGVESTTSEPAVIGTVAHSIAEKCLRNVTRNPVDFLGKVHKVDGFKVKVDQPMVEAVQLYVDLVRDEVGTSGELMIEQRFHLESLHENLFGTADAVVYHKDTKTLTVYDYKNGFVPVPVVGNPQLMYYAVGASFSKREIDHIRLVVVQPNAFGTQIKECTLDAMDLFDWMDDLVQYARATDDPDAPRIPGEHCDYCPGKFSCPELLFTIKRLVTGDIAMYDPDKLREAYEMVPVVEKWLKDVKATVLSHAQKGACIPGYKLVQSTGRRAWIKDEELIVERLREKGLDDKDIIRESLKTLTDIEKLIGKKDPVIEELTKSSVSFKVVKESEPGEPVPAVITPDAYK